MESKVVKKLRKLAVCSFMLGSVMLSTSSIAAEKATVYQAFQSILYLPLYVGMNEGIFDKEGLEVKKVTASGGAQAVAAVVGGSADFSLGDPMTAVLANLKGGSTKAVAMVVSGVPAWVIVPKDSPIKSFADISNQTFATAIPPSTTTYLFQNTLKEHKLTNVKLNTVQVGTELAPVQAGRADGAVVYQPQLEQAVSQGYRIVYDYAKQFHGVYEFSAIVTKTDTIKNKPAMVQKFVTGLAKAEKLMQSNPNLARSIARKEFPTLDPKVVDAAVDRMLAQNIYPATPEISQAAFNNAINLQISIGNIKPGQVAYHDAVDNSFAQKAVK
ncbi:ABC transporter substrate-binding protein [Acinetobacter rathckeae]|uniref:ABC transporter substrate-binding protein n=1 Tax=Acinetobacter rathckeae TaxID=2605272 RepID=UPI0018A2703C|nr:ABC transporter substrate-binding protein [Acinetobacter rathckeae]MBF7688162.1 ABC transporter substrate-binding protein [Acinetobacter rathckeae]MBF7695326.1 ABC transporter substrate-binding protein [Acinetobacter rathckeae]